MPGWTCLQNNKNNKTNESKLLIPESGHLYRRMQEVGTHHHHPNPSNEQITHSLTFSETSVPEEGTSFDRKRLLLMHRTERASLSSEMTENSGLRRIRLRQTRRSPPSRKFSTFAPAPTTAAACRTCRNSTKGVLLF